MQFFQVKTMTLIITIIHNCLSDVEYPEKTRLRLMEKVPTFPSNIRPRYSTKKLRLMRGPEEVHNTLLYKQYGIVVSFIKKFIVKKFIRILGIDIFITFFLGNLWWKNDTQAL